MAEKIVSQDVQGASIAVVHNWADGDQIIPLPRERNFLREEWGLRDKFVVGYSGNMGRAHEFQTILDTAQLFASHTSIVFLFIGNGAQRPWLESEARRLRLKNVYFRPYQPRDHLIASLGAPDLHLISLKPELEGFIVPSKFYGVIAAGRPTLYFGDKDSEIPQILHAAHCGHAVSIGDALGAADYINQLFNDEKSLVISGANARALFEKRFCSRTAFREWHEILLDAGMIEPDPG